MTYSTSTKRSFRSRKKLGDYLLEAGLIDEKTLKRALDLQKSENKRLGQILIDMKAADDEEIARALSEQLKIPLIRLRGKDIPREIIALVPPEMAERNLLMPVEVSENKLVVAMVNPQEAHALEDLRFVTRMRIDIAVTPQGDLLDAFWKYYPQGDLQKILDQGQHAEHGLQFVPQSQTDDKDVEDLIASTEAPPVVRLVNAVLSDALKLGASDIHIQPQRAELFVRYRIDGVMREIMRLDRHIHPALVSRIKVISDMDISIRRRPQDGRTRTRYGDKEYDLRVATIPTSYGEQLNIRILDQSQASASLHDLGFSDGMLEVLEETIKRPQGIILVTGPTGSGKSTTLYACLSRLNSPSRNIITVEDPIEYDIHGINQVGINTKAGLSFSSGLRSILRLDPDIVMVGEIRDKETASIALQAGMTGHLVFSSVHTNDSPSAINRLMDLGIEPFVISNSLVCAVGQRLVRKICEKCKTPDPLSPQIIQRVRSYLEGRNEEPLFWKGTGCESCQFTGYSGRIGIFELLMMTPALTELITPGVTALKIRQSAEQTGFRPMTLDGVDRALKGQTTIDEVFRVAPPEYGQVSDVSLPATIHEAQVETAEEEPVVEQFSVRGVRPKKILVVDDDDVFLRLVETILTTEDYQVINASNGLEGLKRAIEEKPDLILTDLHMPEMDGVAFVEKLKSQLSTRVIPTIMLTVRDDVSSEVMGLKAGADDYITKPIQSERLLARISRFLKTENSMPS